MVRAMVYAGLPSDYQVMAKYAVHTGDYDEILTAVCAALKVDYEVLMGKSRQRDISDARKIAFRLLRDVSRLTLVQIGKIFNKDHSTVVHSLNAYDEFYQFDACFREKVFRVKSFLN